MIKKKFNFNKFNFNKLNFNKFKKFISKRSSITVKKNKKSFFNSDYRSLYLTAISSLGIILFFFSLPFIFEFKKNTIDASKEIANYSKSNFEKVLDGESLEKSSKVDEGLDLKNLFDDVFKFDDLPSDTVRLSALTIEQLFVETKYNLKDVRETKLVKPVVLSLLPEEMKMIESTKKRKNLFIQIILPLILEENNRIKLDRKKLFSILNRSHNSNKEKKWLNQKFKQYGVINKDLSTLKIRMEKEADDPGEGQASNSQEAIREGPGHRGCWRQDRRRAQTYDTDSTDYSNRSGFPRSEMSCRSRHWRNSE